MPIYSSFLQGVNIGKYKRITMADFRQIIADLGGTQITTIVNSGNAVFHYDGQLDQEELQTTIERAVSDHIGIATPNALRSHEEITAVIAANPYPDAATDHKTLHVIFLNSEISNLLDGIEFGEDHLTAIGREVYLFAPHKLSGTTYDAKTLDKRLSTHVTARNWNTVMKVHEIGEKMIQNPDA